MIIAPIHPREAIVFELPYNQTIYVQRYYDVSEDNLKFLNLKLAKTQKLTGDGWIVCPNNVNFQNN
jgi:hypothetical protein